MNIQLQVVVVAEDEWIIRQTAVEALTEAGFIVIEAEHGAGALDSIMNNPGRVHALFTDVRMPGPIDGFELARRARALVPTLAILVASGQAVPAWTICRQEAGFCRSPTASGSFLSICMFC